MKKLMDVSVVMREASDELHEAQVVAIGEGHSELGSKLGVAGDALGRLAHSIIDLEQAIRLRLDLANRTTTSKESHKTTTETQTSTKTKEG